MKREIGIFILCIISTLFLIAILTLSFIVCLNVSLSEDKETDIVESSIVNLERDNKDSNVDEEVKENM